eukprot:gene11952-15997_t
MSIIFHHLILLVFYTLLYLTNFSLCLKEKYIDTEIKINANLNGYDYDTTNRNLRHTDTRKFDKFKIKIRRLPIIYVYTVVPKACEDGLPVYIQHSLKQAVLTQGLDCDIILASNIRECPKIKETVSNMSGIMLIDTLDVQSNRTSKFQKAAETMFEHDGYGELWITSALRFLIMEDVMRWKGYTEMMHVEADNLLYGRLSSILHILRSGYPNLAATPLNVNKSFITASVLWIGNLLAITNLNDYLLRLGNIGINNKNDHTINGVTPKISNEWSNYLIWMRGYACCKHGSRYDPDSRGYGIKPFAVNEMSMLSYYHFLFPKQLTLFPVVPIHNPVIVRYTSNTSIFSINASEVGPDTGNGIWDSNSWGQYLGGTHFMNGRNKGFTDGSHISGQSIRMSGCTVAIMCGNQSIINNNNYGQTIFANNDIFSPNQCYTAPYARCRGFSEWNHLWNLHVHSKHTMNFISKPCNCSMSNI